MKNKYVEYIKLKDFDGITETESKTKIKNDFLDKELPFSIFLIEEIMLSTHTWLEQEGYHEGWTVKSFSTYLLWNVISCVGNEQDHIRNKQNIILDYLSKSLSLLKNNKDSSLLPVDALYIWSLFDDKEKERIINNLIKAGKSFEGFPPLGKMNIIDTACDIEVDFNVVDVKTFIPITVETSSGASGILPIYTYNDVKYLSSCFNNVIANDDNTYISNCHTWDLKNRKVSKNNTGNDFIIDYISSLNNQ